MIVCLGFLFSQPHTYKMIILSAVKEDTSYTSVEQSLFKQIVIGHKFALVHHSCVEVAVFVHRRVL